MVLATWRPVRWKRVCSAAQTQSRRSARACGGEIAGRGIPENKITVIPNAVNVEDFSFGNAPDIKLQAELGLGDATVLGFIGSFYAYEGIPLLLEAMPALLGADPTTRLLLVGGGPQDSMIRARVEALGLQDVVVLTGRVPHHQVQTYYDLVDIFVYPRLPMRLTDLVTPLKPLEAMAQGKQVVASDVGGHQELIRHGETGWLFRAGSVDALVNAVMELRAQRARWEEFAGRGRAFVESERTWADSVGRYRALYASLLPRAAS